MEDPYKILGISPSATPEEVKKAYFEMAKKYHPDSGDETEVKKFHAVAEAYKLLSATASRKAYDDSKKVRGESEAQSTVHVSTGHRADYRDTELKEFRRGRYHKALLRVFFFTVLIAVMGYFLAAVLGGNSLQGFIAGAMIGTNLSVNRNFDLSSYFQSTKTFRSFRIFSWLMILAGFSYFIWLIFKSFVPL